MVYPAHASEYLAAGHTRYALQVAYNGRHYHGWQSQKGVVSVQAKLERALSKIATVPIKVVCAGRTDAGVHASAQIVHFDSPFERPDRAWTYGVNAHLPDDIVALWVKIVPASFHARFSAVARRYQYVIYNAPIRPALMDKEVTWEYRPLQWQLMQQAAHYLVGRHDFSAYRAAQCQANSPIREIQHLHVRVSGDYIVLDVKANAFLQHMIRNIAGVLMAIGNGVQPPIWAQELLQGQDRTKAAATASPHGLYFVGAYYPETFALPSQINIPHFIKHINY